MLSQKTKIIADAIEKDLRAKPGKTIFASLYTYAFKGRCNITAAITYLKRHKIIEIAYYGLDGTPNYRLSEQQLIK